MALGSTLAVCLRVCICVCLHARQPVSVTRVRGSMANQQQKGFRIRPLINHKETRRAAAERP